MVHIPASRRFLICAQVVLLLAALHAVTAQQTRVPFRIRVAPPAAAPRLPSAFPFLDELRCLKRATVLVEQMEGREWINQLLLLAIESRDFLIASDRERLASGPLGGIIFFAKNINQDATSVRQLVRSCELAVLSSSVRALRPFVAVDHEGGQVHRFGSLATRLPAAADYEGRTVQLREIARASARELRLLGFTLNLAPIAETPREARAFLNTRSWSADPLQVGASATRFVQGMAEGGVACAVKHFPSSGDSDPHLEAVAVDASRADLGWYARSFQIALRAARPAAVVVSHAAIRAVDAGRPASLSAPVVRDWLKGAFAFPGFVIADDLAMGAISSAGFSDAEAAVEAVRAGVDMVMVWHHNLERVRVSLLRALERGELEAERVRDATIRIVAQKLRFGLEYPLESESAYDSIAPELARLKAETMLAINGGTE